MPSAAGQLTMFDATATARNQMTYNVIYSDYPASMVKKENVEAVLDGVCGGFIKAAKFQETARQTISLDGHPGRELTFDITGTTKGRGMSRIYMVGDRLYQIIVVGPTANATTDRFSSYFNSFQFLEKKPSISERGS